jgi:hypothetical protein
MRAPFVSLAAESGRQATPRELQGRPRGLVPATVEKALKSISGLFVDNRLSMRFLVAQFGVRDHRGRGLAGSPLGHSNAGRFQFSNVAAAA